MGTMDLHGIITNTSNLKDLKEDSGTLNQDRTNTSRILNISQTNNQSTEQSEMREPSNLPRMFSLIQPRFNNPADKLPRKVKTLDAMNPIVRNYPVTNNLITNNHVIKIKIDKTGITTNTTADNKSEAITQIRKDTPIKMNDAHLEKFRGILTILPFYQVTNFKSFPIYVKKKI